MSMRYNGIRHRNFLMVLITALGFGMIGHSAPAKKEAAKALTAEDQAKGTAAEVEVTRKVREQLMSDRSLSTSAKNVQVITLGGIITLKGAVHTQAEKQRVAELALQAAGSHQINNELEVR